MTAPLPWVPESACTLPTAEQPLRVAEFDSLFAAALTAASRLDATHARLSLLGDNDLVDRVRDLAARETACCSFFTFAVDSFEAADGQASVRLDVAVPPAQAAVLDALVARAPSARADVPGAS